MFKTILCFCMAVTAYLIGGVIPSTTKQLIVVTTDNWDAIQGTMQCYERSNEKQSWKAMGRPVKVVVGKSGMAWGIGYHPEPSAKREGDKKAPAGVFAIGRVFGQLPKEKVTELKMPYLKLTSGIEAVDDPASVYYNQIVDRDTISSPDWSSSEKMLQEPLYQIGAEILHNYPNPRPKAGSAIFLHIWGNEKNGTVGCTAMSRSNLEKVLFWMRKDAQPVIVQLPQSEYDARQAAWQLP